MHALKHSALAVLSPAQRADLHAVAALHGVTVDAVVNAALGRSKDPEALLAAQGFEHAHSKVLAALVSFPFDCAFCRAPVDKLVKCVHCGKTEGCAGCVPAAGCPTCVAERAAKIAAAKKAALEPS